MSLMSILLASLLAVGPGAPPPSGAPVVVELFTSEGCSSCPPADGVLARMVDKGVLGARVLALGFHVDYWDHIGWHDPYGARAHSDRQRGYADRLHVRSIYTPQMVVDGAVEFVGSLEDQALAAVRAAAGQAKVPLSLSRDGAYLVLVLPANLPLDAEVFLALTEPGPAQRVSRGENAGRTLAHAAVVRQWIALGPASAKRRWTWPVDQHVPKGRIQQAVALLQIKGQGRILGAEALVIQS